MQRVTSNDGKRTPGGDGRLWDTPETKTRAIRARRQRGSHALPLRRVSMPKQDGTPRQRPFAIPTMHDRAMQALSLRAVDPIAETLGDPHSSGFRPARAPADAREHCCNVLARQHAPRWSVAGDIRACVDGIRHDGFLAHIPMEPALLQKGLQAGGREQHVLFPTAAGGPQGGMASPVLAKLALDGREKLRKAHDPPHTTRAQRATVPLVRSADDCIMTGRSHAFLAQEVTPLVEQVLHTRGRERSSTKTHRTSIEDGCDVLGQHLRTYAGTRRITPARKHGQKCLGHIRDMVQAHPHTTGGNLLGPLHPVRRGWATSHRHVVRKATVITVDTAIVKSLWSGATRRHPKTSRRWVTKTDCRPHNGRQGTCGGTGTGHHGQSYALVLFRAGGVPMQRHVTITGAAHPYDPQWAVDVEERLGVQRAHTLKGRRQVLSLWKHQHGLCPVCHQKITRLTGWHHHHMLWRTHGGRDTTDTRVLLHPNCHRQVHSQQ